MDVPATDAPPDPSRKYLQILIHRFVLETKVWEILNVLLPLFSRIVAETLAHASVVLHGWLPGLLPDWSFALEGTAVKEHDP